MLGLVKWIHSVDREVVDRSIRGIAAGLLAAFVEILLGLLLAQLVGAISQGSAIDRQILPSLLVVFAIRFILRLYVDQNFMMAYEKFGSSIRSRLLRALGNRDRERLSISEMNHVMTSLSPRAAEFSVAAARILGLAIELSVYSAVLVYWSPQILFAIVAVGALSFFPALFLSRRIRDLSLDTRRGSSKFSGTLLRSLQSLEYLQVLNAVPKVMEGLDEINQKILNSYRRVTISQTLLLNGPPLAAGLLLVFFFAVFQVSPSASIFQWAAIIYLGLQWTHKFGNLLRVVGSLTQSVHYVDRLRLILDRNASHTAPKISSLVETPAAPISSLELRDLIIGRTTPLHSPINLDLGPRDFLWIEGPSGAGKSTLMLTVAGLLKPISGQLLLNGQVYSPGLKNIAERLAYVSSETFLLDLSIRENLNWGSKQQPSEKLILRMIQLCEADFLLHLPQGLDSILQDGGAGLSGGERQRLALVRACLRRPDLFLIDEGTSSLDLDLEELILSNLLREFSQAIFVISTHRPSLGNFATKHLRFSGRHRPLAQAVDRLEMEGRHG